MKNIFTRNKFLSERKLFMEPKEFFYEEIKRYITIFIAEEFDNNKLSFKSGYFRKDYKSDISKLNKFISDKLGYKLDDFMNEFKSEIYSDDFFTEDCGFLDALLYTYDNSYLLSGDKLKDYGAGDEYVIKYNYGYDMSELGRKYLLQNYSSLEDFYYDCATKFWSVENEEFFNVDNFEKNEINFSTTDKLENGSITILDVNKTFNLYKDYTPEFDNIDTLISSIKNRFENKKDNNVKPFNYKYVDDLFIVGFGDVDLDVVDYEKYSERIGIQGSAKKYNL